MKLASIDTDDTATCFCCGWSNKSKTHKMVGKNKVELTKEEKHRYQQEEILAHLRMTHDRMLLTKQQNGDITEYHGRAIVRERTKTHKDPIQALKGVHGQPPPWLRWGV